jgi:4,5-dihydroxyphthalate decarboxylase
MSRIQLTYSGLSYFDRTHALETGQVSPAGVDLNFIPIKSVGEAFFRQARFASFDASEFSLSTLITMIAAGDDRLVAIPVFPSRVFRHSQVYVRSNAGIVRPENLRGRRVGILEYSMTAALWIRGFLQHDYGVLPAEIDWYTGGLRTPTFHERIEMELPEGVRLSSIGAGETLEGLLEESRLDALVSAVPPLSFKDGGVTQRLFRDARATELEYFERTEIFPIMHTVVIRRDVYEANRWLAQSLLDAFNEAKRIGIARINYIGSLAAITPWLAHELEEVEKVFGGDPYPFGFSANRHVLETALQYSFEQGLSKRLVEPEELFAPEVLHDPMTI